MRWSERPPGVRSRFPSLHPLRFGPDSLSVAVAHLVLVRPKHVARMMTRRSGFKVLFVAIAAVGLAIIGYFYLYPYIPHRLRVESSATHASGRYYFLPLDRVTSCILIGDHIVLSGQTGWDDPREARVTRALPVPAGKILGRSEHWDLKASSYAEHVFSRRDSAEKLTIHPPPGTADLHWNCYNLSTGGDLLIFGSGNWKGGPRSYYGYVVIEPKA